MCGLIGAVAKRPYGFYMKDADSIEQLLFADTVRGQDATGLFGVSKSYGVDVIKAGQSAPVFLETKEFADFKKDILAKYKVVIGHNRKATHGEKNSESAHPFWDSSNKIVLVHNGMIRNHKEFCEKSTVDSNSICNALATKTPKEVFSKVDGSFAMIWYNTEEKKLYFIRNSERPLFLLETDDAFYFCSEASMGSWVLSRNNITTKEIKQVPPNVLFSYDIDKCVLTEEEKIEQEKKVIPQYMQRTPTTSLHGGSSTINKETLPDINSFYTDEDIQTIEDVYKYFSRGDTVIVEAQTYQENPTSVLIEGNFININRSFINVKCYIPLTEWDKLDITKPLAAKISNMVKRQGFVDIYITDVITCSGVTESLSGIRITENMFFDDAFPLECDCCGKSVNFKDLDKTEFFFDKGEVVCLFCPVCINSNYTGA